MSESRRVVVKFGGTSVSTKARWDTIGEVIGGHLKEGRHPLVVCSALSGISNLLESLLVAAKRGEHGAILSTIEEKHATLCKALGVDLSEQIGEDLGDLERVARGIELIGEVSPRTHARVLAKGELMSTKLGTAYLRGKGLDVAWLDARSALTALPDPNESERRQILSAACDYTQDPALVQRLDNMASAVLTQGFIAHNQDEETVLLGRGGSDTSAAYFAAKTSAVLCEIWTDVPGMFTANPRDIRDARLLKQLGYDEAQELASAGAKVLHPRCLSPLREGNIPLDIRCTPQPDAESTTIGASESAPGVKAISMRKGLTLISMDTAGMWQQVGFLADVFACFKKHGLSVDLVSTSEMNVTASLDPGANALDPNVVDRLIADLSLHCRASKIGPCAAVSLVGRKIRGELHKLGSVFALFEEQEVHLLTQAASDLNLTFVVDEDQAQRLVTRLHDVLFGAQTQNAQFGPRWADVFEKQSGLVESTPWWLTRKDELLELGQNGEPAFVYDAATLRQRAGELLGLKSIDRVFFAIKANRCEAILRLFESLGMGFETVSIDEVRYVQGLFPDLEKERILFTPNFAGREEYEEAMAAGVNVTLDNLYPLDQWPELFAGRPVFVRLDPGDGKGHHEHVRTAGSRSKFGIARQELERLKSLCDQHHVHVVGMHCHSGSGIKSVHTWREHAIFLAEAASHFPEVKTLNLGGGLAVPEKSGDWRISLPEVDKSLAAFREAHPSFDLWVEPGRYPVAEAGVLVGQVTQLKRKRDVRYVGVNVGMNSLIRPALYGAYHGIFNLSKAGEAATQVVNIVGPICESADTLGHRRAFPDTEGGDIIVITTAGAYGRTMSSTYNGREPAKEVMI